MLKAFSLAGDGVFSIEEGGYIKLVDLKTNTTSNLVRKSDVQDVRTLVSVALLKMMIFFSLLNRIEGTRLDGLAGLCLRT